MAGILGSMLAGGVSSAATGIGNRLREEAKAAREAALRSQLFAQDKQLQDERIEAQKSQAEIQHQWDVEGRAQDAANKVGAVDAAHQLKMKELQWSKDNASPKNELPAKVQAQLDIWKSNKKTLLENEQKAMEAGDEKTAQHWRDQIATGDMKMSDILNGIQRKSFTEKEIASLIKDTNGDVEAVKKHLTDVGAPGTMQLLDKVLTGTNKDKEPKPDQNTAPKPEQQNKIENPNIEKRGLLSSSDAYSPNYPEHLPVKRDGITKAEGDLSRNTEQAIDLLNRVVEAEKTRNGRMPTAESRELGTFIKSEVFKNLPESYKEKLISLYNQVWEK